MHFSCVVLQFDGYAPPKAGGDTPQAARLQMVADQAAEPQRGLSLCPEDCALHPEPSNWTVPGAERAVKSFAAPCSFRVRDSERCESVTPGAVPEEGKILEVAEFKVVKVKASSAAAAPAVRRAQEIFAKYQPAEEMVSFAIVVPDDHREMINNDAYIHGDVNVRTIFIGLPCECVFVLVRRLFDGSCNLTFAHFFASCLSFLAIFLTDCL